MTIRLRLTIFNAIILLLTTLASFAIGVTLFGVFLFRDPYPLVTSPAYEIAYLMTENPNVSVEQIDDIARDRYAITILNAQGDVLVRTETPPGVTPLAEHSILDAARATGQPARDTFTGINDDTFLTVLPIRNDGLVIGYVDVRTSYEAIITAILNDYVIVPIAALSLVPVVLLLILVSYILTWRAMRPVNRIANETNLISETDLTRRLSIRGSKRDEFAKLARSINGLLDRIQRFSMEREAVLAAQRRFVADAGHELRTPLTSIRGYARMLNEWGLHDETVAREGIEIIERESSRLQDLAEGLLTIARGDEQLVPDLEYLDLRTPVVGAVDAMKLNSRGASIEMIIPDSPIVGLIDESRVRQLVTILLDNAIKYSPTGSAVTVTVAMSGGLPAIVVKDNGVGIAEADLPKIFDRFYRVDESRGNRGAGLGLAIAHQIVDALGARIVVQSYLGRGTQFTITFQPQPMLTPSEPSQTRRFFGNLLERLHLRRPAKS